jgi:hypothetical protein
MTLATMPIHTWWPACIPGGLALSIVFFNLQIAFGWGSMMKRVKAEGRNVSFIPFIGGMLAAATIAIVPLPEGRQYFWLGFFLDPSVLLLILTLGSALKYKIQSLLKHILGN